MSNDRRMAGDIAKMIVDTLGDNAPGLVMVVIANEREDHEGYLEVDGCCLGTAAHTELGAAKLQELAQHLGAQVRSATSMIQGGRVIPRDDLKLPGPRGKT